MTNAGSFTLHLVISAQLPTDMCLLRPKSQKNQLKTLFLRSRSSKVIEFGGNREPMYDFLLVLNSKPYLASLLRYSDLIAKNRTFFPPPLI